MIGSPPLALLAPALEPALRLLGPLSLAAAALVALLVGMASWVWPRRPSWEEWVLAGRRRRQAAPPGAGSPGGWLAAAGSHLPRGLQARLRVELDRAGSGLTAEEFLGRNMAALAAAWLLVVALGSLGWAPLPLLLLAAGLPPLASAAWLVRATRRRRAGILDELPLLVDLMALEQTGGGIGSRRAMELVVARTTGPAAAILRDCLSRSATPGSPSLDGELEGAADHHRIPALQGLAAVVRIQRDEGIATGSPLGNLARGLRDRQRDRLTERGRRALISMLLPVAACILLPFILIVLFPAISQFGRAFS